MNGIQKTSKFINVAQKAQQGCSLANQRLNKYIYKGSRCSELINSMFNDAKECTATTEKIFNNLHENHAPINVKCLVPASLSLCISGKPSVPFKYLLSYGLSKITF